MSFDSDRGEGRDDGEAMRFVAALGAAMASANYPATMVRETMVATSRVYGLDNQFLALPNYVQVGTASGGGRLYISHPDRDLRFDQTFPLATLIDKAQTGEVTPTEGSAELERIWRMRPRFPVWALGGRGGLRGGALLCFGPPTRFLPWMLAMLYTAYAGQLVGNLLLGSYASGFGGGLVLTLCALAVSHRPGAPATISLILPGVLAARARLAGLDGHHPVARHGQHHDVHRDPHLDDLHRAGRAGGSTRLACVQPVAFVVRPACVPRLSHRSFRR